MLTKEQEGWYTQAQATALYQGAGFRSVTGYGGFTFDPARPDDAIFTVVGVRPS